MLLSGIFPPITTPFYPDGEVYYKKIEANVERYSRTPVAGIVVPGLDRRSDFAFRSGTPRRTESRARRRRAAIK